MEKRPREEEKNRPLKEPRQSEAEARRSRLQMLKRMGADASDDEDEARAEANRQNQEGLTEEQQMAALLGFGDFDSTKGKKVSLAEFRSNSVLID